VLDALDTDDDIDSRGSDRQRRAQVRAPKLETLASRRRLDIEARHEETGGTHLRRERPVAARRIQDSGPGRYASQQFPQYYLMSVLCGIAWHAPIVSGSAERRQRREDLVARHDRFAARACAVDGSHGVGDDPKREPHDRESDSP
jgi:hypothetical protein